MKIDLSIRERVCPLWQVHAPKAERREPKWKSEHMAFQAEHELNLENAWSETHEKPDVGLRELQLIDLCWSFNVKKCNDVEEIAALEKELVCDISQSLNRMPWSRACVRSMISASRFFKFSRNRVLHPHEHFALLGFTEVSSACGLSNTDLYDLASQAMSQPVTTLLGVVLLSHRR